MKIHFFHFWYKRNLSQTNTFYFIDMKWNIVSASPHMQIDPKDDWHGDLGFF